MPHGVRRQCYYLKATCAHFLYTVYNTSNTFSSYERNKCYLKTMKVSVMLAISNCCAKFFVHSIFTTCGGINKLEMFSQNTLMGHLLISFWWDMWILHTFVMLPIMLLWIERKKKKTIRFFMSHVFKGELTFQNTLDICRRL